MEHPSKGRVRRAWFMRLLLGAFLLLFAILLVPVASEAASYCDRLRPGGDLHDPNLLACEDFEAPTLHDDVGFGNGAPYYGPPHDHTGGIVNFRGQNGYFQRKYGAGSGACSWGLGIPVLPTVGITCAAGESCAVGIWRADNLWGANSFACIVIPRDGEFGQEIPSLAPGPLNPSNGKKGVFDGRQSLARRVCSGFGCTTGFVGSIPMAGGTTGTTFGVTMAIAYPTNSASSGVWAQPWKHDEWTSVVKTAGGFVDFSQFIIAHRTNGLLENDPFQPLIARAEGYTLADCQAAVAAATIRKGSLVCEPNAFYMYMLPSTTAYVRSRDWPFGTWGCVQAHLQNLGTTLGSVKISFNGTPIIDFDIDPRPFVWKQGFRNMGLNTYANINHQPNGGRATTQTTFRYMDNIHVRAGVPVSCSQIGFRAGARPSPPSLLQIR
jgi:hypothetical protein